MSTNVRNPVLLIHGIKDDGRKMSRLARHLRSNGWDAHTINLVPNWGQVGLDQLAEQIANYAAAHFPVDQKLDIVGFSMGGLVSRYYVQRLSGADRVQRLVTISTPHRGTWMAYLVPNAGCRQMRPKSAFLTDLDRDAEKVFKRIAFTSLWTPLDLIILPARSSVTPHGKSRRFLCAAHPLMVFEPRCHRAVEQALLE